MRAENASLFFKLNIKDILGLNSKRIRILVSEMREGEVLKNLSAELAGSLLRIDQCAAKLYLNSTLITERLLLDLIENQEQN